MWSSAEGALVHCLRGHTHAVRWRNENIDDDDDDDYDDNYKMMMMMMIIVF